MSDDKKAWFKHYNCGQCYYLHGYNKGGGTCEEKYNVNASSDACPSFKTKESVHTCKQCIWLDKPSRGKDCRERGFDENSKACFQYTQAPFGYSQVNGRVLVGNTIANTFEVSEGSDAVPFLIKQGNSGLLITVTPGKTKNSSPTYSVKPIKLESDGTAVLEEPVLGMYRPEFSGRAVVDQDDHGLVQLKFSHSKKKDSDLGTLEQLLSSPNVAVSVNKETITESEIADVVSRMKGIKDKNILSVVGNYGLKLSWTPEMKSDMVSKVRAKLEERE